MSSCQELTFRNQTSLCKYAMCLHCSKLLDANNKNSGTSWIPHACNYEDELSSE